MYVYNFQLLISKHHQLVGIHFKTPALVKCFKIISITDKILLLNYHVGLENGSDEIQRDLATLSQGFNLVVDVVVDCLDVVI